MQLDDLKTTWEKEITMESRVNEFDTIRRRADKIDRRANFAWSLELFTCAGIVIVIFLKWLLWPASGTLNPLLQSGYAAVILVVAFIAVKIIVSRRVLTTDEWTLSSKINIQIEKREKEIKLLSTTAYWYLTPLFVAVILGSYGEHAQRTGSYAPDSSLLVYWGFCLALFIGIYFFQQYHVKKKIRPILDQLYLLRRELEN